LLLSTTDLQRLADLITHQITRQIGHPLVREFSNSFRLALVLLTFYASQFSSIAFPAIRSLFYSNRIRLLIGLFVGFLAKLLVSFQIVVDDIRGGSLVGLPSGLPDSLFCSRRCLSRRLARRFTRQIAHVFSDNHRRLSRQLALQIARRSARLFSYTCRCLSWRHARLSTRRIARLLHSSMAFPAALSWVDFGLRSSFLAPVDGFPGGSLDDLHIGLRVSFLTPIHGFPAGSPAGFFILSPVGWLSW
jgi:hypothetical protein